MFYKPKHLKTNSNSFPRRIRRAGAFVYDEVIWYGKWWKDTFIKVYKLTKNGSIKMVNYSVKAIDKFDELVR